MFKLGNNRKWVTPRECLFGKSTQKKPDNIVQSGTWNIVCINDIPENANLLLGSFALAIKDERTNGEVCKDRFVVQGYQIRLKASLVHDLPIVKTHRRTILVRLIQ